MHLIVFSLIYPFIWLISKLPMKILYIISDGLYLLNYYIIGYRKKVVLENLHLAFPEKSEKEIIKISKGFLKHLTDFIVESIKTFTISEKEISKRIKYKNIDLLKEVAKNGKSISLVGIHQANWEWLTGLPLQIKKPDFYAAYTKVQNKHFEKVIKMSRSKFGGTLYRTSDTIRNLHRNFVNKKQGIYILLSDQSPQIKNTHYWAEFMGIKVPIHTGAETLAKRYDMSFVYWTTRKIKRGYYEVEFELITENPKEYKNYELTDKFIEITERNIRNQPEVYLWSHKRFKHRNKVPILPS
ncbi:MULTISPECIES: lysophospholipid acyltransferase family protein [Polaribacter]|uniref:Lipid A biosynthesis acyltransferase n=1 Tax=Polaribacter sejongensis TaxID=985043 RepID=A0AAJ1R0I7_9FLAO|nr:MULTISPECIES: lysophospholipid acyltransferase family protein [Polaribacter]AUC22541.1 lipid A biosynthesis acyltransferase [Polaribacter sejongensis]MDN3621258.1 lysophospholipid acyltransferase family protein [Polaribacter undariae]UWD33287.1 lysophospholipid acyltransferase family protein [Polaribacter undariae]